MVEIPTDLEEAIDQLRDAIENEGPVPEFHCTMMRKHRAAWPTLWNAIDRVLGVEND